MKWVQLWSSLNILWHFPSLRLKWKHIFQSWGLCSVFHIFCHTECSTLAAASLWIWNSSTSIPSPPLALFVVMLPKTHLTSHSRMSDSSWVNIFSWLSRLLRTFLNSSSVYSCLENPHGQRRLAGYNPWGQKELDVIEWLSTAQHRARHPGVWSQVGFREHYYKQS